VRGHLGPALVRIHGGFVLVNDVVVKGVLGVGRAVARAKQTRMVGLIFREQQVGLPFNQQPALSILPMLQFCSQDSV